jgi:hypothetical protein
LGGSTYSVPILTSLVTLHPIAQECDASVFGKSTSSSDVH